MRRLHLSSIISLCAIVIILLPETLTGQGTWVWNQRTHSELTWHTLESEHFFIHFHDGLESTARDAADISEELWPALLRQIGAQHDYGKIHVTLTAEDEIANGYVLPSNQVFIWVNQNEPAGHFTGSEKWLRTVIAHELQHVVLVNATRTWLGIWNFTTLPFWFIEGTAEYYTESWRVGRSDSRLKSATYFNRIHQLAPHDDGFAKVLYLAEQYGDSALTEIVQWRHPVWKTYSFTRAFRSATGISPAAFHEQWRKAMNTYYYSVRGQKESLEDAGEIINVPSIGNIYSLTVSPDSSKIAYISRKPPANYHTLYIEDIETGETEQIHAGIFRSRPQWSPDGRTIVLGEYHRGKYGALINDIRVIQITGSRKAQWLTKNARANYPVFGEQQQVYYVKNQGRAAQIFRHHTDSGKQDQLTWFGAETHVQHLAVSPDKKALTFMIEDSSGHPDIGVVNTDGSNFRKITDDPYEDLYPVWGLDGKSIFFTSYRSGTPNIFRIHPGSPAEIRQVTDAYTGLYTSQVPPGSNQILADAVSDADSSQFVLIESNRSAKNNALQLRSEYRNWRTRAPEIRISDREERDIDPAGTETHRYRFYKHPRHLGSAALPTPTGLAGFTAWTDAIGKQTVILGGEIDYQPFTGQTLNGLYGLYHISSLRPFLTFGATKNTNHYLKLYDEGLLHEKRDGIFGIATLPINFSSSLYRTQWLQTQISLFHRETSIRFDDAAVREPPESGREGLLSLRYYYLSRLPETVNSFLPDQGGGFSFQIDAARSGIYGEYSYSRQKIQAFKNQSVFGKLTAYARVLAENMSGNYPAQDIPAFNRGISFYPGGFTPFMLGPYSVLNTDENYTLRGAHKLMIGETLFQGTLELRYPLTRNLPVKIFFLSLGGMSISPYLDIGVVHTEDQNSILSTAGVELRNEVQIGNFSAFHIAYGLGQSLDSWKSSRNPGWFFRLGLINPF